MSNRTMSLLAAGAFVAALGAVGVNTASAADMPKKMTKEEMMKMRQMTASEIKSGKMEKCYGVALKGKNCQTARKSDPLSACKIDPSGAVVCSRPAA